MNAPHRLSGAVLTPAEHYQNDPLAHLNRQIADQRTFEWVEAYEAFTAWFKARRITLFCYVAAAAGLGVIVTAVARRAL